MGLCRECILLDLPESEKESIKERMRMEFEERDQWPEKYLKKRLACLNVSCFKHAGEIFINRYRSLPRKNRAIVPGPEWAPMTGPT